MISHFFTRPPPVAGHASDILPFRFRAIRAEHFDRIEAKFSIRSKRAVALTCDSPIGFRNDMNLKQSGMLQGFTDRISSSEPA